MRNLTHHFVYSFVESASLLLGSQTGGGYEEPVTLLGDLRSHMLEMQEPRNLVEGCFRLEMLLGLRLLEDRGVYPKVARGESIENLVSNGLGIFGRMEDLVEMQATPPKFSA